LSFSFFHFVFGFGAGAPQMSTFRQEPVPGQYRTLRYGQLFPRTRRRKWTPFIRI